MLSEIARQSDSAGVEDNYVSLDQMKIIIVYNMEIKCGTPTTLSLSGH